LSDALFELPAGYVTLREQAREVAAAVAPYAHLAERAEGFVSEIRAALTDSGLAGVVVPARFGGRFERVDSLAVTVVREALAAGSGHADSLFAMQGIGSFALSLAGSDELRERWLPAVGRLAAVPALGLTEPDIGSDLKALSTVVRADGDDVVVTGTKSFITNAGEADFYCVLGKEPDVGYSLVLVPADAPGLTVTRPHEVIDHHVLGDVALDAVRVPAGNRIGAPGDGFAHVLATLATFRASVAGAAIGVAEAALIEAIGHTAGREMFGTTLARLGGVPATLATCWTDIEMARSLTYRAAAAAARDPHANLHLSSMAKIAATEASGRVVDRAVQLMGRFGLVRGSTIERLYREARPMRIYEGSTEVILDSLARQLMKRGPR
jgi:acyl-CoA dehydrogenase